MHVFIKQFYNWNINVYMISQIEQKTFTVMCELNLRLKEIRCGEKNIVSHVMTQIFLSK